MARPRSARRASAGAASTPRCCSQVRALGVLALPQTQSGRPRRQHAPSYTSCLCAGGRAATAAANTQVEAPLRHYLVEQERALCRMQCLCGGARPLAWAGGCVHLARPGRPGGAGCTRAGRATVSTCAVPDRERPARRINRSTWSDSPTAANTAAPAAAAGPAPLCVWCLKARAESGAAARGQAAAASMQASSPTARASRRRT